MNPLLAGLTVLDLSRLLPGPFCSLYLAQLGATVIKIEEPGTGDYARLLSPEMFALVNRGKKSITLDLKKPEDVAKLHALAKTADVVLESFRPGVMDKLCCGYAALKAINPRLVFCALTGYGQDGPWREKAGHDLNYCGYAGVLDQTGAADAAPAMSGFQIADLAGGALTAALGIVAAAMGAKASGEGCFVDAAMLDGTLALQTTTLSTLRAVGAAAARGNDMLSGALPNYAVYETADGQHMAMGALESKFFMAFCKTVERPDLAKLPLAPGPKGEALRSELTALFKSKTRDEWAALLADADCCVTPILKPGEALDSEQAKARGLVESVAGKPAVAMPLVFDGQRGVAVSEAPRLGADNAAILGAI
ncbi:MAG: CaiB/BaiF CoA-transferase family protein [Stagnimonas sp.]|nr:CaiB/BaiF CoA-transferase family protein [Stagnimonas sp.]